MAPSTLLGRPGVGATISAAAASHSASVDANAVAGLRKHAAFATERRSGGVRARARNERVAPTSATSLRPGRYVKEQGGRIVPVSPADGRMNSLEDEASPRPFRTQDLPQAEDASRGEMWGPEVRSGDLPQPIMLKKGDPFTFTIKRGVGTETSVSVNYDDFVNDVESGDTLLIDGGMMSLEVKSKTQEEVLCEVVDGGELKSRRHLNVRGKSATLPSTSVAGGVVALGKFDGLHLGHRALVERASELGKPVMLSLSGVAEVLGLEPKLPVVAAADRPRVLASWAPHCRDTVPQEYVLEFADVRQLSPDQFVEKLAKELKVKGAVAGADYRFGFKAAGKASDLVELCEKYGLQSRIVEPVMDSKGSRPVDGCAKDKGQVSTTRIRKALAEGDMKRVAELLDRKYRLYLEVKDSVQTENVISLPIANVLNQPPTVGSYQCSLYLEGSNDSNPSVLQARINETEISLESTDSSLVHKISLESRIALDFLP